MNAGLTVDKAERKTLSKLNLSEMQGRGLIGLCALDMQSLLYFATACVSVYYCMLYECVCPCVRMCVA